MFALDIFTVHRNQLKSAVNKVGTGKHGSVGTTVSNTVQSLITFDHKQQSLLCTDVFTLSERDSELSEVDLHDELEINSVKVVISRSLWPSGLRREFAPDRLLGLRVPSPAGGML